MWGSPRDEDAQGTSVMRQFVTLRFIEQTAKRSPDAVLMQTLSPSCQSRPAARHVQSGKVTGGPGVNGARRDGLASWDKLGSVSARLNHAKAMNRRPSMAKP